MDLDHLWAEMDGPLGEYDLRHQPPLLADKWICSSAMQKAVRRGETEIAISAARTLLAIDRQTLWRRLQVIAFEDAGVGDAMLASRVTAAFDNRAWRKRQGGDARVVPYLIECMCTAPKDRSTDHLLSAAKHHPDHRVDRDRLAGAGNPELLDIVQSEELPLPLRSLAAWYLAGTDRIPGPVAIVRQGDLGSLSACYGRMGVPEYLLAACQVAARRLRQPMPILIPLIWSRLQGSRIRTVEEIALRTSKKMNGIPTYALDPLHTRSGKEATRVWWAAYQPLRAYSIRQVNMAVFQVEGAAIRRRLTWDCTDGLIGIGIAADLAKVGVERQNVDALLNTVRNHLPHLDAIRMRVIEDMPSNSQRLLV